MALSKKMLNKNIVNKIRDIIPTYRYTAIKEFYDRCAKLHKDIAHEAITKSIENIMQMGV